ncbi:MAG: amidophosphoribosyltransferase [Actinomycetota bacterium]
MNDGKPKEACGVVAVYAPGQEVAKTIYYALYALQHRGEESAGIAVSEGDTMVVFKDMGLVGQVFDEYRLKSLTGGLGIGHVRYSTTGSSSWENAQPIHRDSGTLEVALGHNGNLVNTMDLLSKLAPRRRAASTDSDLIAEMIVNSGKPTVEEGILDTLPRLKGAFTLVMMDHERVYGCRDPHGLRPLVIGSLSSGGYVMASETCALDAIGAVLVREVEPGELVTIDAQGIHSHRFAAATPALCVFEYVYFARADSVLYGKSVHKTRYQMGRRLWEESPAVADLVMPVPDSGRGAAAGYAAASGIPYGDALFRSPYVGRTFIQPTQAIRQQGIRTKLNPMAQMIEGKTLVVVDDSIVRGNSMRQIVRMLRDAGAKGVHVRVSSPPVQWPCFYGIDIASRDELIAANTSVDEIRQHIEADSLGYLSLEGMLASTELASDKFCTACFSSEYPIAIPDDVKVTKNMLEAQI